MPADWPISGALRDDFARFGGGDLARALQGRPTLHTDEGRTQLCPGMCAGFKAGTGNGHCLVNETTEEVVYLEVGDQTPGDEEAIPMTILELCSLKERGGSFTRRLPVCVTDALRRRADFACLHS